MKTAVKAFSRLLIVTLLVLAASRKPLSHSALSLRLVKIWTASDGVEKDGKVPPHGENGAPCWHRKLQQDVVAYDSSPPPLQQQTNPSTAAVVAGVVGGLGGLTLVLAGALILASGVIQQWRCCAGWTRLLKSDKPNEAYGGDADGRGNGRRDMNVASIATMRSPSTSRMAGTLDTGRRGSGEVWALLSAGTPRAASFPLQAAGSARLSIRNGGRNADGGGGSGSVNLEGGEAMRGSDSGLPSSDSALSPLSPLASDLAWRECLIDASKIQVLRRPSGAPWRLGGGSFGQVYKALYDDVQVVAVKVLAGMNDPTQLEAFLREGRILRDCRDRNIVQFVGAAFDPESDQAMLVTEYMEAGDLWRALRWRDEQGRRVFGWPRRGKRAALDAARGLHYLHSRRIIHLDLKSANILLSRDGTAKLADVGLAKMTTKDYLTTVHTMGTFAWASPEVLTGQKCDEKADIFSFGVVLWEICTGEAPSRGTMRNIEVPDECPAEIQAVCDRCMSADPRKRPTAKELVKILEKEVGGGVDRARTLSAGPLPSLASPPTSPEAGSDEGMPGMLDAAAAFEATIQTHNEDHQQSHQYSSPHLPAGAADSSSNSNLAPPSPAPACLAPPSSSFMSLRGWNAGEGDGDGGEAGRNGRQRRNSQQLDGIEVVPADREDSGHKTAMKSASAGVLHSTHFLGQPGFRRLSSPFESVPSLQMTSPFAAAVGSGIGTVDSLQTGLSSESDASGVVQGGESAPAAQSWRVRRDSMGAASIRSPFDIGGDDSVRSELPTIMEPDSSSNSSSGCDGEREEKDVRDGDSCTEIGVLPKAQHAQHGTASAVPSNGVP